MRVWLNPDKMAKLGITATDVSSAIQAQNRQNPAGAIGQPPSPRGTDFQYSVTAPGRLADPRQFDDIVVRAQPDASLLRVRDIGRVGTRRADVQRLQPRRTASAPANVIVYLAPGANAVETRRPCRSRSWRASKKSFPPASTTWCRTTPRCSCAPPSRTCW